MGVRNYVHNDEFKRVIEDKMINSIALKHVLKKKGILPICTTNQKLAESVYCFFFGSEIMTEIRDIMNFEQNNLKSTMTTLEPVSAKEDFIDTLSDLFIGVQRIPNSKYKLKNISKKDKDISLQFSYSKFQKGRVEFVSEREVSLDVKISADDKQKYKVSVLHEGISDSKPFFDLMERVATENKERKFYIKRIGLSRLVKKNKIEFFDLLGKKKYDDWKLVDITNVTVNKNEKYINEDEYNETETEIDEKEATGKLTGIKSAILNGDKLLSNDFVKEFMEQGFIFSSMRYKFEHKKEPWIVQIDISFKQTDLKVNIAKSYISEDDGQVVTYSLGPSIQAEIIEYFQNQAYLIFNKLLKIQEKEEILIVNS